MILLTQKLKLPYYFFGILMPLNQEAKKGVTVIAGDTDPDCQGELKVH